MKQEKMTSIKNSYLKELKRLKSYSPDWKPISWKEYVQEYRKQSKATQAS